MSMEAENIAKAPTTAIRLSPTAFPTSFLNKPNISVKSPIAIIPLANLESLIEPRANTPILKIPIAIANPKKAAEAATRLIPELVATSFLNSHIIPIRAAIQIVPCIAVLGSIFPKAYIARVNNPIAIAKDFTPFPKASKLLALKYFATP